MIGIEIGYWLQWLFGWWAVFVPPAILLGLVGLARWYINRKIPRQ
jgi:hypothetical protein